jgi:hypothetical protein
MVNSFDSAPADFSGRDRMNPQPDRDRQARSAAGKLVGDGSEGSSAPAGDPRAVVGRGVEDTRASPLVMLRAISQDGGMKARSAAGLSWVMALTYITATVLGVRLSVLQGNFDATEAVSLLGAFGAFMAVGSLIVARRPGNSLGWAFAAVGLLAVTGELASEYASYSYVRQSTALPGAIAAAWYSNWSWFPTVFLAVWFPLLFFPTGRLLSARWRPVAWVGGAGIVALTLLGMLDPSLGVVHNRSLANPIGIAGIPEAEDSSTGTALLSLLLLSVVAALIQLVFRFRQSRGEERQQLKWFTYAGAVMVFGFVIQDVIGLALPDFVFGLLIGLIPLSVGVAILTYRLYDIDLIINRTLVYGLVTAVLALVYIAGVVGVGGVVREMTGHERNNLVVAASTLAVAGLFRPARTRIQAFIDRRFYRSKYDAQQTIADFSAKMREQIDLDSLTSEMAAVVRDTVQPTHVSLWIRS